MGLNKSNVLSVISIESLKTLKYQRLFNKILGISIICGKCGSKDDELFQEEESIEILKILGLIKNI